MSIYTTTRHIDVTALGFPCMMRANEAAGTWTIEADVNEPALKAAVDAAPLDPTPTRDANRTALQEKAAQALSVNAAFLAIASPTNVQTLAQVKALTRECNGLIRLALNLLDDTSGT